MRMEIPSFGKMVVLAALAVLACSGCGKPAAAPAPVAKPPAAPLPTLAQPSNTPGAPTAAAEPSKAPAPPELAPVEQGIKSFQAQYNRAPTSVFELLEKKCLKEMPKLPPGKTLYIDPATGRAQISDGP